MKFVFMEDDNEQVVVYAKERTPFVDEIESICEKSDVIADQSIFGYDEDDIILIAFDDIYYINVESNKTFVSLKDGKYQVKYKLYEMEQMLGGDFIQINKSAIINTKQIKRFNSSWEGTLLVELTNGVCDYVSRRKIKTIKEKLGLK